MTQSNASARRLLPVAMLERRPQVRHVKITFQVLPNNWFVSKKIDSMKHFVNWIPLNINVRSNQTKPCLRAVPSRISKQKQKQVCTSHTECVTNL